MNYHKYVIFISFNIIMAVCNQKLIDCIRALDAAGYIYVKSPRKCPTNYQTVIPFLKGTLCSNGAVIPLTQISEYTTYVACIASNGTPSPAPSPMPSYAPAPTTSPSYSSAFTPEPAPVRLFTPAAAPVRSFAPAPMSSYAPAPGTSYSPAPGKLYVSVPSPMSSYAPVPMYSSVPVKVEPPQVQVPVKVDNIKGYLDPFPIIYKGQLDDNQIETQPIKYMSDTLANCKLECSKNDQCVGVSRYIADLTIPDVNDVVGDCTLLQSPYNLADYGEDSGWTTYTRK
jgi:hypothetical protein